MERPTLAVIVTVVWGVLALPGPTTRASSSAQIALASLPVLPVAYVLIALVVETAGVFLSGQPMGLHSTVIHQ